MVLCSAASALFRCRPFRSDSPLDDLQVGLGYFVRVREAADHKNVADSPHYQ